MGMNDPITRPNTACTQQSVHQRRSERADHPKSEAAAQHVAFTFQYREARPDADRQQEGDAGPEANNALAGK